MQDKYGQVYYTQDQVCDLLYRNPKLDISQLLFCDPQTFNNSNRKLYTGYAKLNNYQCPDKSIKDFDKENQVNWHMPDQYKNFDIVEWLVSRCQTDQELERVALELDLFQRTNLLPLLCYLKYMVDIMNEKNLVWGVGRGSSTASYVLYLIGLHNVDSLKYEIPIEEFFKIGEKNV